MLSHVVLFNLVPGMTADQIAAFEEDARALARIETVRHFHFGKLAGTEKRPVIQTDWDYMLTVLLDDLAGHDAYQVHPLHLAFATQQRQFFAKVRIFDAE